jgi:hypothetical protein
MSSANAVELVLLPEATYGTTPPLNAAQAGLVRFTKETLSGTPTTTESTENRLDRMSGGQIVTGLDVGGAIDGELSPDAVYQRLFQMGMMDASPTPATAPLSLSGGSYTKDATNAQLANLGLPGGGLDAFVTGDMVILAGLDDDAANGAAQVVSVNPDGRGAQVTARPAAGDTATIAAGATVARPACLSIGVDTISATLSKAYTDVLHDVTTDAHSQRYTGAICNGFSVGLTYGQLVTITYNLLANGYLQEAPSLAQQIDTAGGTIADAGTANVLNASIDMGLVTVDGLPTAYCVESLKITLDNGNTPQNCLGHAAPSRYNPGTAKITLEASIYLADAAYDAFMPGKLKAEPVGMLFAVSNDAGGYAFELTAAQLSFPDPAVTGQNAPVMIAASGTGKVGPGGASALRVYYWGGVGGPAPGTALKALTGPFSLPENAPAGATAGAIHSKTSGSTLSLTDDGGGTVALSGANIVRGATPLDYATAQSHPFTVRETLPAATNSPRDTNLTLVVTQVAGGLAAPHIVPDTNQTTYPVALSADLGVMPSTDQLQCVVASDAGMANALYTSPWVTVGASGPVVFPGLESFNLASGEIFVAVKRQSGAVTSAYSNVLKWGDTTAPIASGGGTVTLNEHLHVAIPVTFSELVYPALGGTNAGAFELTGATPGTAFTVRLLGDGLTDYETAPALSATVSGTDLGGNVSNPLAIGLTVINDPTDDAPFDYTPFAAGYEPAHAGSVWQDTAGTVPATADGDPVRRLDDVSGHGWHLTQPAGADHFILHVAGLAKWLRPNSGTAALSNAGLGLSTGSVWQRMTALLQNDAVVSNRLYHSGDGGMAGLLYHPTAPELAAYDGASPSTGVAVPTGENHTILENHGSGNSWVQLDTDTPPPGVYAGNTLANGITLGNHPTDTGPGSATSDFRLYAFAVTNDATFAANEAAVRAHFQTLYA